MFFIKKKQFLLALCLMALLFSLSGCRRVITYDTRQSEEDKQIQGIVDQLADAEETPVFGQVSTFSRDIALIYEGYADEATMMALADLLNEENVPTVFFLPGREVMSHTAVVEYISSAGIPIGNYTMTGEKEMQKNKPAKNARQFYVTQQAIKQACGVTPSYLRCNLTEYTSEIRKLAFLCGFDAVVEANVFLNHRSFSSAQQASDYIRSIPRGSIVTIKLGQELDISEMKSPPVREEKPADDLQPGLDTSDEATASPAKNDVDPVTLTQWVLDGCALENRNIVSLQSLQDMAMVEPEAMEVPEELLEKLDIALYPDLVTPLPFGVSQSVWTDDSIFDKAVFIGDSIGVGLETYVNKMRTTQPDYLGNAQFLVAGGLSVRNALWEVSDESRHPAYNGERMLLEDAIGQMDVDKVYILLGLNDVMLTDVDTFLNNYKTLIQLIRQQSPGVEFYIQSITPGTATRTIDPTNYDILRYDLKLVEFCAQYGHYYIDIAYALRDETGNLPESMCSDPDGMGFHFTDEACGVWIDYLRTHVPAS